jgi:hypothetical protein
MLMLRCVERNMSVADWRQVAASAPDDALIAARSLSVGGKQAPCAASGFQAILETPNVAAGPKWGAVLGLHGTLMARGRSEMAARFLDSMRVAIQNPRPWSYAALYVHADSVFSRMAAEGRTFAMTQYGPNYEKATAKGGWVFGLFEAWQGNKPAVAAVRARLSQLAAETPNPVTLLASASMNARAALLDGDTVGAIAQLQKLPMVAPRDSLLWLYFEPLAPDRLTLARLLLATGRPAEALAHASAFDHQQPVVFLAFLRPSLELRAQAAEQLGNASRAAAFRARLRALGGDGARQAGR